MECCKCRQTQRKEILRDENSFFSIYIFQYNKRYIPFGDTAKFSIIIKIYVQICNISYIAQTH